MDVEIGIQNVSRTLTFTTDKTADEIITTINKAVSEKSTADFVDSKGRHFIVPGTTVGYIIVGSQSSHPVGFGTLN